MALPLTGTILLLIAGVPPPTPGDQAGCATSTYAIDAAVCGDPGLRAADERMHRLTDALAPALAAAPPFVEPHAAWFARRNACAMQGDGLACVRDAYAERLALLDAMAARPPAVTRPIHCGTPLDAAASVEGGPIGPLVLRGADGTVLLVAGARGGSSWRPFVQYLGRTSIRFSRQDGAGAQCR